MASLLELLAGTTPSEQDYYSQSPYLSGAKSVSGWNFAPQSSSEALWMPAIQGLLSGTLTGYGMSDAARESYSDVRKSPLVRSALSGIEPGTSVTPEQLKAQPLLKYLSDEMPEGFTPKQARADSLMALLAEDNARDERLKKQEIQEKFKNDLFAKGLMVDPEAGTLVPVPGFAEAEANSVKLKKQAENAASEVIPGVPAGLQDEAVKEVGVKASREKADKFVDEQFEIAKKIPSGSAMIPGTTSANEMEGVAQGLRTFIQKHLGREMNGPEQQSFLSSLPDWNDTKAQIELKKARFKSLMEGTSGATPVLDAYKGQSQNTQPVPTGEVTRSGKKVYIINGVKGTID